MLGSQRSAAKGDEEPPSGTGSSSRLKFFGRGKARSSSPSPATIHEEHPEAPAAALPATASASVSKKGLTFAEHNLHGCAGKAPSPAAFKPKGLLRGVVRAPATACESGGTSTSCGDVLDSARSGLAGLGLDVGGGTLGGFEDHDDWLHIAELVRLLHQSSLFFHAA